MAGCVIRAKVYESGVIDRLAAVFLGMGAQTGAIRRLLRQSLELCGSSISTAGLVQWHTGI